MFVQYMPDQNPFVQDMLKAYVVIRELKETLKRRKTFKIDFEQKTIWRAPINHWKDMRDT